MKSVLLYNVLREMIKSCDPWIRRKLSITHKSIGCIYFMSDEIDRSMDR